MRIGSILFAAFLGAACVAAAEPAGRAAPAVPTVISAAPAAEWDAKFAGKSGWVGGDGAYSAVVGPGRVLWLFGDSLIGEVRDGGRAGAAMVNNTIAVQSGLGADAAIRFVHDQAADGKPAAVFRPADGRGWLWTQAAVRVGGRLFVFLPQLERGGEPGAFGFRHVGQWLATVENPDEEPERWRVKQTKVPFATFAAAGEDGGERSWGSAVLHEGEDVYVYGYAERGKRLGSKQLLVARAPAGRLDESAAWRFWSGNQWSDGPADAAAIAGAVASELSVSRMPGGRGYVAVYTENGLGPRIVARFADAPQGPWSAAVLLYTCPEMARDQGVFTYAAKAHPWAARRGVGGDELLVSYCQNTFDFAALFRDEAVYRPRFVRVRLGTPG